eukprot:12403204-Karenia_brevis.AAC.1
MVTFRRKMQKRAIEEANIIGEGEINIKGRFTPSQWVLGKLLRRPGDISDEDEFCDIGAIEEQADSSSQFYRTSQIRAA